jgi:sortase (surface protein transpeptidase)
MLEQFISFSRIVSLGFLPVFVFLVGILGFSPVSAEAFSWNSGYNNSYSSTTSAFSTEFKWSDNFLAGEEDLKDELSVEIQETKAIEVATQTSKVVTPPPTPAPTPTPAPAPKVAPKPSPNQASITIPKIGLNGVKVHYASMLNLADLDNKMLYRPIVENQLTPDFCTPGKNTYMLGHSEPAISSTRNMPGVYIFSNLHKLQAGDLIHVRGNQGQTCSYRVTHWEKVTTDSQDRVSSEVFYNLLYPKNGGKTTLTVQTCQKGSATVRLILRAELV